MKLIVSETVVASYVGKAVVTASVDCVRVEHANVVRLCWIALRVEAPVLCTRTHPTLAYLVNVCP